MIIDTALVRRLIASQFPRWAGLAVTPVERDGWDNRTFRLGDDMCVRLPSAAAYAAQVEKEQRWLPRLAPRLPLAIPVPLAMGAPAEGYPWRWSVYRWLDGEDADADRIDDLNRFAADLAAFLVALQRIDTADGPAPSPRHGELVWLHGDVNATNLLVREGRLGAVIDFGCCGVGDPVCDYAIAWTLFRDESRRAFRDALPVDDATWARGRGWALWKALITLAGQAESKPAEAAAAQRTIDEALTDGADR